MEKIRLGISRCLLGEKVRYDGQHKLDHYLVDVLGRFVDYVPVCPEVECGLPVPREAMRLVGSAESPRLLTIRGGVDLTGQMLDWMKGTLERLRDERLCGYIFKSNSPSSGLFNVKVYPPGGNIAVKNGVGIFARGFTEAFPLLPVEEEGRLHDERLRENFIERVFAYGRWLDYMEKDGSPGGLVNFHTAHKLMLMAHHVEGYRKLGALVAGAGRRDVRGEYLEGFMRSMGYQATVSKNVNVLEHIMGYFKKELSGDEKAELLELIGSYRRNLIPLIVPITMLNHYVRKYSQEYLSGQYYLHPHPDELKLRNHV